jgi:hypothetical protein
MSSTKLVTESTVRWKWHGVGELCRRCGKTILTIPYYSKRNIRGGKGQTHASYYHRECWESLFQ